MRICFIADLRSSIARSWISGFVKAHDVHVLTTASADPLPGVTTHDLSGHRDELQWRSRKANWSAFLDPISRTGRIVSAIHDHAVQPLRAALLVARARRTLSRLQPRVVHSLRIPVEGEIGAVAGAAPHVISAWGNDFTLYADRGFLHLAATRFALAGCAGFIADAEADVARARRHGLAVDVPTLVVPGSGGVRPDVFGRSGPADWRGDLSLLSRLPESVPVIVNPRGFRRYVRNDSFFAAARLILLGLERVLFVGVGMKGWKPIESLVDGLGLRNHVLLTGPLPQEDLSALYRRASVSVSPTEHDGTPNSLLEAMACGCFPVCGELPSIREWIEDGRNGLLVAADRPLQIASAIRRALADSELRSQAAAVNARLVEQRASYDRCIEAADALYERVSRIRATAVPVAQERRAG